MQKERIHRVRTGYRQDQDVRLKALEAENAALWQRVAELEARLEAVRGKKRKGE